jgi:indole-3-glycerol phosphate synthase
MRMSYMASECRYNVTNALKITTDRDSLHQMSVLVDLKRRSPTVPHSRNIVEFASASGFAELLTLAGADGFLVNTDETEYGGRPAELRECSKTLRRLRPTNPPAVIHKDIIIHPIQIAQALEEGAGGVLLIVAVVGGDLEVLLDACTIMGTEALVEVHTPEELEFALNKGATIFLVNMWDRISGKLFRDQVKSPSSSCCT